MNEQTQQEIWQVEVAGTVYEAPFEELQEWVNEGSLQPDDKVRRGNLRWIEAKRVPALIPFFNAKANNTSNNVQVNTVKLPDSSSVTNAPAVTAENLTVVTKAEKPNLSPASINPAFVRDPKSNTTDDVAFCSRHQDIAAAYICDGCSKAFCKGCPSSYGGSVRICPDCGQLCREIDQIKKTKDNNKIGVGGAFGFNDLIRSFSFPFTFKASLVLGGFMYMMFTLGQSARGIGGVIFAAAALICWMFANTLTFGILANTIDNFTQGKFNKDFMPSFDEFSIWDDVVHPFFLSIAAYVVSFGPFFIAMVIAVYLVMSSVTNQIQTFQNDLETIPGTPYYTAREVNDQSSEVSKVLTQTAENAEKRAAIVEDQTLLAESAENTAGKDQETIDQEKLWQEIQDSRKEQFESVAGKTDQQQQLEYQSMIAGILKLAAPLVVVGVITFLWGLFFFPVACIVAGYTRSFFATINPIVGLDTIRRLGFDYVKTLLMTLVLVIMVGVISVVVAGILYPFDIPRIGNLPAVAINAVIGFYFSVVFACLLGFLLYKASDRLKLPK